MRARVHVPVMDVKATPPSKAESRRDRWWLRLVTALRGFLWATGLSLIAVAVMQIAAMIFPVGNSLWVGGVPPGFTGCYGRLLGPGCTDDNASGLLGFWAQFIYMLLAFAAILLYGILERPSTATIAVVVRWVSALVVVVVAVVSVIFTATLLYDVLARCTPAGSGMFFGASPGTLWCRPDVQVLAFLGPGPRWWVLLLLRFGIPIVYILATVAVAGLAVIMVLLLIAGSGAGTGMADRALAAQRTRRANQRRRLEEEARGEDRQSLLTAERTARLEALTAPGRGARPRGLAPVLQLPAGAWTGRGEKSSLLA